VRFGFEISRTLDRPVSGACVGIIAIDEKRKDPPTDWRLTAAFRTSNKITLEVTRKTNTAQASAAWLPPAIEPSHSRFSQPKPHTAMLPITNMAFARLHIWPKSRLVKTGSIRSDGTETAMPDRKTDAVAASPAVNLTR
jgi:hypothetical protein